MNSATFYKWTPILLLIVLIVYAGWNALVPGENPSETETDLTSPDIGAEAPIPVQVAPAMRRDLVVRITATGTTRAFRQLTMTTQVAGSIWQLRVKEGDAVVAGDTLLQLDDAEYRLVLQEAEEALKQATLKYGEQLGERRQALIRTQGESFLDLEEALANFQQAKDEWQAGRISKEAYLLAEREYAAAKMFAEAHKKSLIATRSGLSAALLAVEKARLNLQRTILIAPFSGVVGNLKIQAGQQLNAGSECFTLFDLDSLLIDIDVLESQIALVQPGRRAEARFSAFPNEVFKGRVWTVNPVVDQEKKVRRATVLLPNPKHKILPGMHASVRLDARIYPDRLLVPREAVVFRDQRPVVFIARKNQEGKLRAVWSYVELGRQNEDYVEILSSRFNLKEGEQVIISNHYTMVHDAPIRIVE